MQSVEVTFNSHEKYKALLAKGFSEEQAEGIVEVFSEITIPNAATKEDISNLNVTVTSLKAKMLELKAELKGDISELRTEIKSDMSELKAEVKEDIGSVRSEMQQMETRLTKLIYINSFAVVGILGAVIKFL